MLNKKKQLAIFSVLLWAQLVFALGLMVWRYQLILSDRSFIYPSSTSPDYRAFAEFVDQNCPSETVVGYLSDQFNSYSRMRYALYPRTVVDLRPALDNGDLSSFLSQQPARCIMVDYLTLDLSLAGDLHNFTADQYLLILPE